MRTRRDKAPQADWPKVRLGTLGQIIRGNGIKRSETTDKGLPCLRYGEIYTSYNVILNRPRSFVSKEVFDRSLHISKGDLVFTLTGETEDEIAKTLAYLGDDEIAAGGDLAVWKNHGCDPKFLSYLMYTPDLIKAKALASNGQIIVHISVKKFQEIEIPLPPLSVQREIVARLEKELASVDRMVKGFEAMKAEADQLFKAELKEAFEDIKRRGAETRRLGEIGQVVTGSTPSKAKKEYYGGDIPFFNPSDLDAGYSVEKSVDTLTVAGYENGRKLPAGSVLVTCIGATLGKTGIIRVNGSCNQQINAIVPDSVASEYLYYWLISPSFQTAIWLESNSTTLPIVNKTTFSSLEIPVPPLTTQREIVTKLDAVREKCAKLKSAAEEGLKTAALLRKAILKEAFL